MHLDYLHKLSRHQLISVKKSYTNKLVEYLLQTHVVDLPNHTLACAHNYLWGHS